MGEDARKLTEEEEREELHLDRVEELEVRTHEELGGGLSPIIELLVCDKCAECRAFADVIYDSEIGDVVEIDSIEGQGKLREYGLTERDHPVLIANGEVQTQFIGKALTDYEFREWYALKYGEALLL